MAAENKNLTTQQQEEQQKKEKLTVSEKFTNRVLAEFGGNVSGIAQVTDYQRRLIQGYFIGIDRALKTAEERRVAKNAANSNHSYDEELPVTWSNVNLNDLAMSLVHYARIGLDMMQDNHLFPIPYKNNRTKKYDITLMEGYNGIQYIAEKYALVRPKAVTIELVYSTDSFKPIKKSRTNAVEAYEFEINNAFDRGDIVGGFGYIEYEDKNRNKLVIMTLKDILKRKPEYAAAEFWGGKKKVWKNGKKTEEDTDGWFEEMCLKTIKREVYSAKNIPRDPMKIDESYHYLKAQEMRNAELEAQAEIDANANKAFIDVDITETDTPAELPQETIDMDTGELIPQELTAAAGSTSEPIGAAQLGGPDF